jgi:hypothetical protein
MVVQVLTIEVAFDFSCRELDILELDSLSVSFMTALNENFLVFQDLSY